jgi:hypothetical protein
VPHYLIPHDPFVLLWLLGLGFVAVLWLLLILGYAFDWPVEPMTWIMGAVALVTITFVVVTADLWPCIRATTGVAGGSAELRETIITCT